MKPLARKNRLVLQEAGDDLLIYDLNNNRAVCLNETSTFIWQICDGNRDIAEIQTAVEKKFGETVTEDLVWFAIDQLKQENLITNSSDVATGFEGLSRRAMIRKAGLSSMVVLPFITALTAPPAGQAASICNSGQQCTCPNSRGSTGGVCSPGAAVGCSDLAGCRCINLGTGNSGGRQLRSGICST